MSAEKEKHLIRPYGDRKDDGVIQLSFVLPVSVSEQAKEAAAAVAKKLGLSHVLVSAMEQAGEGYSFFVVYGRTHMQLDYDAIEVPVVLHRKHPYDELNDVIRRDLGRRIVVVGACIGTDSHTTGIDAIMNMKGFAATTASSAIRCSAPSTWGRRWSPRSWSSAPGRRAPTPSW